MPHVDPEAIVRRFFDALGADQTAAEGAAVVGDGGAVIAPIEALRSAVPDLCITVKDVIAADGVVVVRWAATGTVRLWPLPDMALDVHDVVHVVRVHGGRIVDVRALGSGGAEPDEEEDDDVEDDDGGPAPPGPRWVPPVPRPKPKRPTRSATPSHRPHQGSSIPES